MTRRGPTGSRRPKKHGAAPAKPPDWRAEDPNLELEKQRYADPIASRELLLKHLTEAPEPLTRGASREAPGAAYGRAARCFVQAPGGHGARRPGDRGSERLRDRRRRRAGRGPSARPSQRRGAGAAGRRFGTLGAGARRHGVLDAQRSRRGAGGRHERSRTAHRPPDSPHRRSARRGSAAFGTPATAAEMAASIRRIPAIGIRSKSAAKFAHGAADGDNVIVEITKRPQGEAPAHGRIVEVLEDVRPSDLAARFAILRHDLPQEFPPEVLHEANVFEPDVRPCGSRRPRGSARSAARHHRRRGCQGFRRRGVRRSAARRRLEVWSWPSPM